MDNQQPISAASVSVREPHRDSSVNVLEGANSVLENLLRSMKIATIFLDANQCVRGYTPAATDLYELCDRDVGRPLVELKPFVIGMPAMPDTFDVFDEQTIEDRLQTRDGRAFIRRVLPYRSHDNNEVGIVVTFSDVTDLHESESLLLRSLDAAKMYWFEIVCATGEIRRKGNRCATLGIGETGSNNAFCQRVHEKDRAELSAAANKCSIENPIYSAIYRFEMPDGRYCWLRDDAEVFFDDAGVPQRIVGTTRDVTLKRQAQLKVEQQQRELKAITDATPAMIAYVDSKQRYRFANESYANHFNWTTDGLIGRTVQEVLGECYPRVKPYLDRALTGHRCVYELTLRRSHGPGEVFKEVTYIPDVDDEGVTNGCYVSVVDITNQKETIRTSEVTEKRLQRVIDGASVGIAFARTSGQVIRANNAALRMIGVSRKHFDREGFSWTSAIRTEDLPKANEMVRELRRTGRMAPIELQLNQGSSQLPVMVSSLSVESDSENRDDEEHVVFMIDLSKQKQYEESLDEARRVAERANETKSEFLANMSHEIRTPMSAIIGYLDILARNLTRDDDLKYVSIIRNNSRFLLEIINDILDVSKIEAGKLALHKKRFRPEKLIADVRSLMDVRAAEKDLKLEIEFDGEIPKTIRSDDKRLKQILVNLIGNAIKFTEEGTVQLRVRFEPDQEKLEFDVIDTGIGMNAKLLSRLFQPFTQGDSSLNREFGGTGLGLTISQRLANMLGGEIVAESKSGYGSKFSLRVATGAIKNVPLVLPNLAQRSRDETTQPAGDPPTVNGRILIVDDRPDLRYLATRILEEAGATVESAEDGQQAMVSIHAAAAIGKPFDLVVMDMQMPVLDGYEATRRLRENGFDRPIIALTAHAMKGDRQRCIEAGCTDYLTKPLDQRVFLTKLDSYLQQAIDPALPRTRRILVVDDSIEAAEALKMLLECDDHIVEKAYNGATAIETIRNFRPQLVLLDLGLPDMSGFEVLSQVKRSEDANEIYFVALTGQDNAEETRNAGFDHHMLKPVDIDELEQLVASLR